MLIITKTLKIINKGTTAQVVLRIIKHNTEDLTNQKL